MRRMLCALTASLLSVPVTHADVLDQSQTGRHGRRRLQFHRRMARWHLALAIACASLTAFASPPVGDVDEYNSRGCGWPLLLSPEGPANFQGPDDAARYWIMPFDTTQHRTMTIKGTFPHLRYFAISAYEVVAKGTGYDFEVGDPLYDAEIIPDQGANPFVKPGGRSGTFTIEISRRDVRSAANSGIAAKRVVPNTMMVSADLAWIVIRAYVPDADASLTGLSLMGGVPLPTITLTNYNGVSETLDTCSPINKWSDLMALGRHLFPPAVDMKVDEGTPISDRLWFAALAKAPGNMWPNPDGKYIIMMPGNEYQKGRIVVIRAKAPGFPDTFNGSSVWEPARGFGSVDVRYWAMCNMNLTWPPSVVDCATDLSTRFQAQEYTIVMSDDRQRPDWLKPNVNWVAWGDVQYPKFLVLRNVLPSPGFQHAAEEAWKQCPAGSTFPPDRGALDAAGPCAQGVMGDYYPVALWCDKATFMAGGFDACMRAAD